MTEYGFRWGFLVVLLLNLSVSASFRYRARRATGTIKRSSEPKQLIFLRLLFGLPLLLMMVGYAVFPGWSGWPRLPVPEWMRWSGLVVGMGCPIFLAWTLKSLGSNVSETVLTKKEHQLVTHGPYRWIRHPLYLGGLVMLVSLSLISASVLLLVLTLVVALMIYTVVVPKEEEELRKRFGDRYS